ncbi:MAG: glycosyltransferase [Caulobacterales bacterium]
MRISLLDPGLAQLRGHHFDIDRRVARALAGRGHQVEVHGHASATSELTTHAAQSGLTFHPTFRAYTYGGLPKAETAIEGYGLLADITAQDLAGVPQTDLWLWPTLTAFQLLAAASTAFPVRQIGGVWFTPRWPLTVGARGWARAARRVAQGTNQIIVAAYDEPLRQLYRSFSPDLDIGVMPCPFDGAANDRQPSTLRRIGFFGHQRGERGLDLMPELVAALLGRNYEVVVHDSGGALTRKESLPGLEMLAFVDDFAAEIARCDLVIWPSRWESYAGATSGVVSECIATGVPVILPSGCLPADLAVRFGCGTFFHEFSCEAILEAVDEAAARFPTLVAQARAAVTAWRAKNGTERLVDWIVARASEEPSADR